MKNAVEAFIDGNGRTGRLLANFTLMRSGYLPISVKYENRRAYYEAFTAYHAAGDLKPMLRIFAEGERLRLEEYLKILGTASPRRRHPLACRCLNGGQS